VNHIPLSDPKELKYYSDLRGRKSVVGTVTHYELDSPCMCHIKI